MPIRECFVLKPELLDARSVLEDLTRIGASRSAELSFIITQSETGLDLSVNGGKPLDAVLARELPKVAQPRFARLTWNTDLVYADSEPRVTLGSAQVRLPPGAFLQATLEGERALQRAVAEAIQGATRIADLFCGVGTFALPLASERPVHAVEGAPDLLTALTHAANTTEGLKPVTTELRDLFRRPLLSDELAAFDAVVIDPPRAGAEAQIREIAKVKTPRLAMVSCNPVTFARDAAHLVRAGYRLDWVQPIDQFRWSPHVELAARLSLDHIEP